MKKNCISSWASHSLLASLVWTLHHSQFFVFFSCVPQQGHRNTHVFPWSADIYNNRIECHSGPYRIIVIALKIEKTDCGLLNFQTWLSFRPESEYNIGQNILVHSKPSGSLLNWNTLYINIKRHVFSHETCSLD